MFPQRVYRTPGPESVVVNSQEELDAALHNGYHVTEPQEFPKMVYLHPEDKTHEHATLVVNNPDEQAVAEGKGYKLEPHIPVVPPEENFEGEKTTHDQVAAEAQGSGSEKYGAGDWTQTQGEGITDNTQATTGANAV